MRKVVNIIAMGNRRWIRRTAKNRRILSGKGKLEKYPGVAGAREAGALYASLRRSATFLGGMVLNERRIDQQKCVIKPRGMSSRLPSE